MRAIPTKYGKYYFRSRLEARWAIYFDAVGIKYMYELEGFILDDGSGYLPDFYFPQKDLFGEVKPTRIHDPRWDLFVADGTKNLMILLGEPHSKPCVTLTKDGEWYWILTGPGKYHPVYDTACLTDGYYDDDPTYYEAIQKACSARFE